MRAIVGVLLLTFAAGEALGQAAAEENPAEMAAAERIVRRQQIQLGALQGHYAQPYRRVYGPPYSVLYPTPWGVPSGHAMPYYAAAAAGPAVLPAPAVAPPVVNGQPFVADDARRLQNLLSEVDGAANPVAEPPAANGNAAAQPDAAAAQPLTPRQQAILGQATANLRQSEALRDYLYGRVRTEQFERQADIEAWHRASLFPAYGYGLGYGYGFAPPPVVGYGEPVFPGHQFGYFGW